MSWFRCDNEGVLLFLRIVPDARKNEIAGMHGDRLRIRVQSPPVDGKANKALIRFLAKQLAIPARSIEILSGEKGREKQVYVKGIGEAEIHRLADIR